MATATTTNKTSPLVAGFNVFPDGSFVEGTFTANGATNVTVAVPELAATHSILITLVTVGGTVGALPSVKTRTNGTGFAISGTASDTSIYSYKLI
jgi:hypothetical protein